MKAIQIIERQNDCILNHCIRYSTRCTGSKSCKPTASFYHKCINMAMITALKFDDFAFTGISSGQSDGRHDCFCTGTNKPHFFKKAVILYDELTHLCAITCGCTKTCTLFYRFHYGFLNIYIIVTMDQRPP